MTSSDEEPLKALKAKLSGADKIVEQTLKAHAIDDPTYDTLKHEAFAELNEVLIEIKSALNAIDPDLNLRPIDRMLEEFRNVYGGSTNLLMMHENPDLSDVFGRPRTADKNEYMALLVAAVNVSRGTDRNLTSHLERVARKAGLTAKQVKNIRTRFMRDGAVDEMYRNLAFKFSKVPDGYGKVQYFETLMFRYNELKTK